jgi:hypothetical protein
METFLAVLMALGIFIGIPIIIALTYVGVVSGLFKVIRHRAMRKISASRRKAVTIPEESMLEKVTQR